MSFDPWGPHRAIREWLEPHVADTQNPAHVQTLPPSIHDRDADPLDDPVCAALEAALGEPEPAGRGRRVGISEGGSSISKLPGNRALSAPPFNEKSGGRP